MRMDPTHGEPVAAWLARASHDEIRQVIASFGEERFARRVAQAIVAARREQPLTRTGELATLVAGAVRTREPGKHPATRTFQALRMFINDELGQLERGLSSALDVLAPGGRLAVISFHSLEDRLVKRFMQRESQIDPALKRLPVIPAAARPALQLIGRKIRPADAERERNPRARGALLIALPILWVAALGSAAGAIWCKHRAREMFIQLESLNARRDNLDIEWGQLQLEQSAWSTHAFVERVASARLHMAMPPPKEIEIIAP
jgi:cell division protein FtsL